MSSEPLETLPPLEKPPCTEPIDEGAICEPADVTGEPVVVRGEQRPAPPVDWSDSCVVDGVRYDPYVIDVDGPGSEEYGFAPCSPVIVDPVVAEESIVELAAPPPTLPATGTGEEILAVGFIGTVLIILGVFMTRLRRRYQERTTP